MNQRTEQTVYIVSKHTQFIRNLRERIKEKSVSLVYMDQVDHTAFWHGQHPLQSLALLDEPHLTHQTLSLKIRQSVPLALILNQKNLSKECLALTLGFKGVFLPDDPIEHVVKGIDCILQGEFWFRRQVLFSVLAPQKPTINCTEREKEIFQLLIAGYSNKQIAEILSISVNTARTHVYNVFKKTGARSRLELMRFSHQFHPPWTE